MKKSTVYLLGALCCVALLIAGLGQALDLHPVAMKSGLLADFALATVVTVYGTAYKDPTSRLAIEGIQRAANLKHIRSLFTITNGDSIASKYFIGSVPSNAKLVPGSSIYFDAITSAIDCDIGVFYPNGGAVILADCIVNGHDIHTAGSTTLAAATGSGVATPANMEKAVWELAGLSSDPGGELDLVMTINAAATATGKVFVHIGSNKGA